MYFFKKTQRLLTKNEYNHVFEQAKKIVTSEFIVLFRENNLGYARLGLALSKKMIATAHERNRIKRLIREGFRQSKLLSVDVVFLARQGLAEQINANISARLGKIWIKLTSYYEK